MNLSAILHEHLKRTPPIKSQEKSFGAKEKKAAEAQVVFPGNHKDERKKRSKT